MSLEGVEEGDRIEWFFQDGGGAGLERGRVIGAQRAKPYGLVNAVQRYEGDVRGFVVTHLDR